VAAGWDEIERRATDGRSGAGSVITHVRHPVAEAHVTLLETLADACLSEEQPDRRIGLARKLADA